MTFSEIHRGDQQCELLFYGNEKIKASQYAGRPDKVFYGCRIHKRLAKNQSK